MKQLVIMPGGFHPFHAGHAALYQSAVEAFPGADVYVAATNDTSTRPFPFPVKEKLAQLAGVAPRRFVQVKSPFRAEEIVHKFDPNNTQLIFVRSEKDAGSQPRPGGTKKDGTPSYLQPYDDASDQPLSQRAYMAYLPTVEFGPGMTSATEIRGAWPKLNEKRKTALVMSLYPKTQTNPKLAATVVKLLDTAMGTELNEGLGNWIKSKFQYVPGGVVGFEEHIAPSIDYVVPKVLASIPKDKFGTPMVKWKSLQDAYWNDGIVEQVTDKLEDYFIEKYGPATARSYAKNMLLMNALGADIVEKIYYEVRSLMENQLADESALDNLPRPNKRNQFKSIHKQRKQRGLDEVDAQNFVGGMTAGYQRRENQPVAEGPFVQRIMHPGRVSIYVRSGKVPKLVATDIPYEILDRYIAKVIAKYPQFKPSDFSFESSDKVSENQGWAATYEGLKPDAFAALQQAKQNIEQNRQQEVDQWEQDFRANSAKLAGQQPKQRFNPPAVPVAQPGEKHSVLKNRIAQLDQAIKKQQQLDALSQKLEYKGLLTPAMQQDFDTRLLVRGAAADNYQALNLKLDRAIEIATNRLRTNKLAFKENADYIDEAKKQ